MFHELLRRVAAHCDGDRALGSLRAIARHHRIQASPGYDAAAADVAAELERAGLAATIERVPADGRRRALGQLLPEGWSCSAGRAWLVAGDTRTLLCDFDAEPLSIVQRSAPARGRFPLVLDDGDAATALRGAIVLTSRAARPALERCVRGQGAAGILCDHRRLLPPVRERHHDPDSLAYTSFWWAGDEPRAFGFVISPRVAESLRGRLAAGEQLALDVELDTQRFATEMPLVSVRLGGAAADEILVVAHLCHPRPGANDNASGAAAAIETARVLAALAREPAGLPLARGIRLLWMPELTGTFAWLARAPERMATLTAALNLDMVGEDQAQCGSTLLIEHPPAFAASFAEPLLARIRDAAQDWVTSFSGPGHYSLMRMAEVPYSGGSDHAVFVDPTIGVPCPLLIQWPDRYYHSSFDTPDRCDPRSLALAVRCAATYAATLASAGEPEARALLALVERDARVRLLRALDGPDAVRALRRERLRGATAIASLGRLGVPPGTLGEHAARYRAFAEVEALRAGVTDAASGSEPSATSGSEPSATSGSEPFAASGSEPFAASGSEPFAASASEPSTPGRIPVRAKQGPLDFLDHQNPGWDQLDAVARDRWRALRSAAPDPALELAWFAADGARSLDAIARLVALEVDAVDPAVLAPFFELLVRMRLAHWKED